MLKINTAYVQDVQAFFQINLQKNLVFGYYQRLLVLQTDPLGSEQKLVEVDIFPLEESRSD